MLHVVISENLRASSSNQGNTECRYCNFLLEKNGDRGNSEPWNTVLYESDNFVVVPTLGSLVEGWLLIVSKEHLLCMGAVTNILRGELEDVIGFTKNVLKNAYEPLTIFEHGPSREGTSVGCGVDHAHIHLVPLKFSLLTEARVSEEVGEYEWNICRGDLWQLGELYQQGKAYLYIKEPGSESVYCTPKSVPCQSLRRIIARKLGVGDKYDYNQHPFKSAVESTIKTVQYGCSIT